MEYQPIFSLLQQSIYYCEKNKRKANEYTWALMRQEWKDDRREKEAKKQEEKREAEGSREGASR